MFRTLIYPSSGTCDCVDELPHRSSCSVRRMYVQSQIHIKMYIKKALYTKQPMKNNTHKRTQWSQIIIDSGQNQLKYTYQLQQGDKTHHTKHTTTHRKVTLIAKTSVFTEQDDRCGNSSTQSRAPEDGYINFRNMLSA